jgi:hypothetical protein
VEARSPETSPLRRQPTASAAAATSMSQGDDLLAALLAMADDRSALENPSTRSQLDRLLDQAGLSQSDLDSALGPIPDLTSLAPLDQSDASVAEIEASTTEPTYDSLFDRAMRMAMTESASGADSPSSPERSPLVDITEPIGGGSIDLTRSSGNVVPPKPKRGGLSPRPPATAAPLTNRTVGRPRGNTPRVVRPAPASSPVAVDGVVATLDPTAPRAELLRLGVPARYACVEDLTVRGVSAALDSLPTPAADPATGVIAVVGDLIHARQLAAHLAADAAVASRDMPRDLAAWLWISNLDDVNARKARWAQRERPMVVAVEGTPASEPRRFANALLAGLGASRLRVIVEASWSIEAVAHWLTDLQSFGLPLQLEVVGVDMAAEPAAMLQLGLPIATLDGRAATPEWWASVLVERLGDPER